MGKGLRAAWLFAVYGGIAFGGEYAWAQRARDDGRRVHVERIRQVIEPEIEVVVEVDPDIEVEVDFAYASGCEYTATRTIRITAAGLERLDIEAGAGELRVEGRADVDEIAAVGEACASTQALLEELLLSEDHAADGRVTLAALYPDRRGWRGNHTAKIDLTVLVPLGLAVGIDDASGEIEVSGTGDLWIDDSSGSVRVNDIGGSVRIDDSSGGLELANIDGDVVIDDGSGEIAVRDVRGSLRVRDGSGGIDVVGVTFDVIVEADGSGGIDVRGVGGDLIVERDGSGGVDYADVSGRVDVPEPEHRRGRRGRR